MSSTSRVSNLRLLRRTPSLHFHRSEDDLQNHPQPRTTSKSSLHLGREVVPLGPRLQINISDPQLRLRHRHRHHGGRDPAEFTPVYPGIQSGGEACRSQRRPASRTFHPLPEDRDSLAASAQHPVQNPHLRINHEDSL